MKRWMRLPQQVSVASAPAARRLLVQMLLEQPGIAAICLEGEIEQIAENGIAPTTKSMPTLPSMRASMNFEVPVCQA